MAELSRLIQQRHTFDRCLLAVEVISLVGLRGLQQAPRLVSLVYLAISAVAVLADSPLLPQNRLNLSAMKAMPEALWPRIQTMLVRRKLVMISWFLALAMELIWQLTLMLSLLWSLVNALAAEPVFSGDLLKGAAAGRILAVVWDSPAASCSTPYWCSTRRPSPCRPMATPCPMASATRRPCWELPSPALRASPPASPSQAWASSMWRS
ncbi:MAG: hypothetical protein VKK05_08890 [Synechococcus sp.]|jgi:hypothetical protein|nr:hypothetical protein [Synechococcus sp.]